MFERFPSPEMVRQARLTCEDVGLLRQRRADIGIGRFRRNSAEELRLCSRLNCLLESVSKSKKRRFGQESAVHPKTGWLPFRCETYRDRDVRVTRHRGWR